MNQKKTPLIDPSRTLKTTSKKNFCFKSLPTMGASTWFLCVTFYVYLQSFFKLFTKTWLKSNKTRQGVMKGLS